jgi:hypothetical protein
MSQVKPRPLPAFPKHPETHEDARQRAGSRRGSVLSRVSENKRDWRALYVPWLAFLMLIDPFCRRCRAKGPTRLDWNLATEGHHPYGQQGALILCVLPFCRECHDEVENNKTQARKDGWIRYRR